jgi:hypothetical protein
MGNLSCPDSEEKSDESDTRLGISSPNTLYTIRFRDVVEDHTKRFAIHDAARRSDVSMGAMSGPLRGL